MFLGKKNDASFCCYVMWFSNMRGLHDQLVLECGHDVSLVTRDMPPWHGDLRIRYVHKAISLASKSS